MMTARPQTVGYGCDGLAGRPRGVDARASTVSTDWTYGADPAQSPTKDDVLDNITLYWLTNTATSARGCTGRTVARGSVIVAAAQKTAEISLPVAITVFPETSIAPRRHGPGAPIAT